MLELAAILVGSALGGVARMSIGEWVARRVGMAFPWHTLTVNVSGALAIGVLAGSLPGGLESGGGSDAVWSLLGVGALGSYTTVSSFSLESLALARAGAGLAVAANIALSLGLCTLAAAVGLGIGGWL